MTGRELLKQLEKLTDEELEYRVICGGWIIDTLYVANGKEPRDGFKTPHLNLRGKFVGGELD